MWFITWVQNIELSYINLFRFSDTPDVLKGNKGFIKCKYKCTVLLEL